MGEELPPERNRFYERRLPSGGYIAIEVATVRTLFGGVKIRGEIVVERRPDGPRRQGHRAPIAACTEQSRLEDTLHALLPYAKSDEALADALGRKVTATVIPTRQRPSSS